MGMRKGLGGCLLSIALGGCAVGPDFVAPPAELPASWQCGAPTCGAGDVAHDWWRTFDDPEMASLVERAVSGNLDVLAMSNRLEQSRIHLKVNGASQFPNVGVGASYRRAEESEKGWIDPSGRDGKSPYELWGAAFDLSWEVDLWGHVRRRIEAAQAEVTMTSAEMDGVLLSVAAETASDYLKLQGVREQLSVTRESLLIAERSLALVNSRYENGVTTRLDVHNATALISTVRARMEALGAEQVRLLNALAMLVGQAPGTLDDELLKSPSRTNDDTHEIPVGIPSEIARRRPDIRMKEADLHRATAEIGAAKADFYPRVILGANYGYQTLNGSSFGSWAAQQWSYGPSLYLPLFQGGRLVGTLALRRAQQQAAAIAYRKTVLLAWHEVSNVLSDYAAQEREHRHLTEAVEQNREALAVAEQRYKEGAIDYLNVLNVQRTLLLAQSARVESGTKTAIGRVRLYKALGGGWPGGPIG